MIKELKSSTIQYTSSKDLENKIIDLIERKEKLNRLKKEAEKNSKYFSLASLQKYFTNELLNRLDDL